MSSYLKLAQAAKELAKIAGEQRRNLGYQGIRVLLRTTDEVGKYEFVAENTGDVELWDVHFNRYEMIGPLRFGIDDTYMKAGTTVWPPLKLDRLPARSKVSLHTTSWSNENPYWPPTENQFHLSYALQPESDKRRFTSAPFFASRAVPIKALLSQTYKSSYAARSMPTFYRIGRYLLSMLKQRK
jgi:hypothetical protein